MRFDAANGWQFFVATLLVVIGCINIIQGLVALFVPEFYFAADTEMLLLEYASWGVLLGLWGVVLVVAGMSVLSGSAWARVFAIVLASLNALAQLAFVVAMPLWSMVAIAIDVLVIYGLTAGWPRLDGSEEDESEREAVYRSGYEAARAAPRPTRSPEDSGGGTRRSS